MNMKPLFKILISSLLLISYSRASAQEKIENYGNIPSELVAYDKYMKAYKYHFLEPMQFYGAGREKLPPTDLTEVRIRISGAS